MLTINDKKLLSQKDISEKQVEEQIKVFKTGFPFLKIIGSAKINKGITQFESNLVEYINSWENYRKNNAKIVKFVPASGAASRMFKALYNFLEQEDNNIENKDIKKFFENINKFAFYNSLNIECEKVFGKTISQLIEKKEYKNIVKTLLKQPGLNYGHLPKGLLEFHNYNSFTRKSVEEHLVEAGLYAANEKETNIHFTISHEHKNLFLKEIDKHKNEFENRFAIKYNISFSEQKSSTDTIAVDKDNKPFRDLNGNLLFRPGGHGALIENLNAINADVIFIKNIDNVVPEKLNNDTISYKKAMAGLLVSVQKEVFKHIQQLENENVSQEEIKKAKIFLEKTLCCVNENTNKMNNPELKEYLISKLNRPIRVCGMVKNEGEPGGGPYIVESQDGSTNPQILESTQINMNDERSVNELKNGTHFNPVDLVCGTKNYKNEMFNLIDFVDKNAGFISNKSSDGKELKALELPGLWNGAMSNWNTIFVEVPLTTFNPVKTVNDLLREQHQ